MPKTGSSGDGGWVPMMTGQSILVTAAVQYISNYHPERGVGMREGERRKEIRSISRPKQLLLRKVIDATR